MKGKELKEIKDEQSTAQTEPDIASRKTKVLRREYEEQIKKIKIKSLR